MITAIIPAFNEEEKITKVIEDTKKHVDYVIVVDDGSSDNTFLAAEKADIVLKHVVNMGKGLALKTGFEAALKKKTDIIVTIDSDGQHNPNEIPKLVNKLKNENLDVVIGSRKLSRRMPFIFRIGNLLLREIFKFLFNVKIKDTQCGFRAFKSEIYPLIKWGSLGYAVETEILANVGKNKLKYAEIPVETIYANKYKGTTIIDGVKIFFNMLKWKFLGD